VSSVTQDLGQAEAFWRRSLAGFAKPTFLTEGTSREAAQADYRAARHRELRLAEATTSALREMARRCRLTLNTLVQGAWACPSPTGELFGDARLQDFVADRAGLPPEPLAAAAGGMAVEERRRVAGVGPGEARGLEVDEDVGGGDELVAQLAVEDPVHSSCPPAKSARGSGRFADSAPLSGGGARPSCAAPTT
jgi:hypothetical protein